MDCLVPYILRTALFFGSTILYSKKTGSQSVETYLRRQRSTSTKKEKIMVGRKKLKAGRVAIREQWVQHHTRVAREGLKALSKQEEKGQKPETLESQTENRISDRQNGPVTRSKKSSTHPVGRRTEEQIGRKVQEVNVTEREEGKEIKGENLRTEKMSKDSGTEQKVTCSVTGRQIIGSTVVTREKVTLGSVRRKQKGSTAVEAGTQKEITEAELTEVEVMDMKDIDKVIDKDEKADNMSDERNGKGRDARRAEVKIKQEMLQDTTNEYFDTRMEEEESMSEAADSDDEMEYSKESSDEESSKTSDTSDSEDSGESSDEVENSRVVQEVHVSKRKSESNQDNQQQKRVHYTHYT